MEEYLDDLGTTITLGSYEDIIALAHIGIEPAEMALAHYFAPPMAGTRLTITLSRTA